MAELLRLDHDVDKGGRRFLIGLGVVACLGAAIAVLLRPRGRHVLGRNHSNAAKAWVKHYHSEAYLFYIRTLPCIVPGCKRPSEAAHAVSKGAGGTYRDLFPCCHEHHMEQHAKGIRTFMDKYSVDPKAVARQLYLRWLERHPADREI